MIEIRIANQTDDVEVLALLGRVTYSESHAHFIDDKKDLLKYSDATFSISKTKEELNNPNILFYLLYSDGFPIGFTKLVLNSTNENIISTKVCCLERIYILDDFIPLKVGQKLLDFTVKTVKELEFEILWLSVYVKNDRAIRFYERNGFENVGVLNFIVNGKEYENIVFSKKLQ
tara:strand:+ start:9056 stop:9577 length:522 start_codon:yes stop_codon:yes gene_type:complete